METCCLLLFWCELLHIRQEFRVEGNLKQGWNGEGALQLDVGNLVQLALIEFSWHA